MKATIETVTGKQILKSSSSLTEFTLLLEGGLGLLLQAVERAGKPAIEVSLKPESDLPWEADAVCKVDWSWISGANIERFQVTDHAVSFLLDPAGPLTVSVQVWQGKPFLAFQPFRPAR